MIDERELNAAIAECVENPSSANVCQRLASYYIIQDHLFKDDVMPYSNAEEPIRTEYSPLPAYNDFVEAKRQFQQGTGTEQRLIDTLNALLRQIQELIKSLYVNSNTDAERSAIIQATEKLNTGNL